MDWDEYRQLPLMNASTIVHGAHSMRRLKRAIDGGFPEETDAMRLGTGIHALLLEPSVFTDRFVVMPSFERDAENLRAAKRKDESDEERRTTSKGTSYYRARVAEFVAANESRTILTQSQYDISLQCIAAIRSRPYICRVIDESEKEVTLRGVIGGVPFKGRVDLLRRKRPLVCDLKTTADCSKFAFGRVFARLKYDMKLAIYRELVTQTIGKSPEVAVITQEPGGDFDTAFVPVPSVVLDNAYARVLMLIAKYVAARDSDTWPGVDGGADRYELAVPNWAMEDDEDMDWESVDAKLPESEAYF